MFLQVLRKLVYYFIGYTSGRLESDVAYEAELAISLY